MLISKETLKNLFASYFNSLPYTKDIKKAVEKVKTVEIVGVSGNSKETKIVVASPKKAFKLGKPITFLSTHLVKLYWERKAISCTCPHFKKHKICKHTLNVLLILYTGKPTYWFRKILHPEYKANRERAYVS